MRWDNLFDDLGGQLERQLTAEGLDLEAEEERLRLGRLGMRDRIVALHAVGASAGTLRLTLTHGDRITVRPTLVGQDWFSADFVDHAGQCIVPIAAIAGMSLTTAQVVQSLAAANESARHPSLSGRLGLPFVLRDLCRRRRALELVLASGVLRGTIDRVGRDHVDVAVHEPGTPRRDCVVSEYRLVPLDALLLVVL